MTFKEFCKELLEEYGYIIFQYDSVISFTQTFPDTTCGLGGIGGQAFTDAQIFIFVNQSNRNAMPCYASSERYHNYRECLGAAIVKAMNLAD